LFLIDNKVPGIHEPVRQSRLASTSAVLSSSPACDLAQNLAPGSWCLARGTRHAPGRRLGHGPLDREGIIARCAGNRKTGRRHLVMVGPEPRSDPAPKQRQVKLPEAPNCFFALEGKRKAPLHQRGGWGAHPGLAAGIRRAAPSHCRPPGQSLDGATGVRCQWHIL